MTQNLTPESTDTHPKMLGPFLGHVTSRSIRIWLHLDSTERKVYVTLHPESLDAPACKEAELLFEKDRLFTDCVTLEGLGPGTLYFYRFWKDPEKKLSLPLDGLEETELRFWTLSDDPDEQVDFLVLSCHNPTVSGSDGYDGLAVWADLPQIMARDSNKKVRFALLVGDQIYADDWESLKDVTKEMRFVWSTRYGGRMLLKTRLWPRHQVSRRG